MFFGEFVCLILYFLKRQFSSEPAGDYINPLWIAIPACFDIVGSSLMFIALTMVAASIFQMMRGCIVVITAFMALVFLGRKQYAHHWISLFTIVLGVFIVGFVSIKSNSQSQTDNNSALLGILLLLLA